MPHSLLLSPSPLSEASSRALRELLSDPQVALPLFGGNADDQRIDRYLRRYQPEALLHEDRYVLALNARAAVLGAASIFDGALSFVVAPSCWGRGIGRELVDALCADSPGEADCQCLSAMVYRENLRSRRLLESTGFAFRGLLHAGVDAYAGRAMLRYERQAPCAPA
jgi:RimJ/RimL family protein N-acetyltransferase